MRKRPRSDESGSSGSGSAGAGAGAGAGGGGSGSAGSVTKMEKDDDDTDEPSEKDIKEIPIQPSDDSDEKKRMGMIPHKKPGVGDRFMNTYTEDEKQAMKFLNELGVYRELGQIIMSYFPDMYEWEAVTEPRRLSFYEDKTPHVYNITSFHPYRDVVTVEEKSVATAVTVRLSSIHNVNFTNKTINLTQPHIDVRRLITRMTADLMICSILNINPETSDVFFVEYQRKTLRFIKANINTGQISTVYTLDDMSERERDSERVHAASSSDGTVFGIMTQRGFVTVVYFHDSKWKVVSHEVPFTNSYSSRGEFQTFFDENTHDFIRVNSEDFTVTVIERKSGYVTFRTVKARYSGNSRVRRTTEYATHKNMMFFGGFVSSDNEMLVYDPTIPGMPMSRTAVVSFDLTTSEIRLAIELPPKQVPKHVFPLGDKSLGMVYEDRTVYDFYSQSPLYYQEFKPNKRYTGPKKIKSSDGRLIHLPKTVLQIKSKEFYALITTLHHPSDLWPKVEKKDSETVYFIEGLTHVLARFVVTRQSHVITINEIRMEPVLASSMTAVGRMINHLLLGTVLGHEIQLTMVEKVILHIDSKSTLPWKEYGFVVEGNTAVREYISPSELPTPLAAHPHRPHSSSTSHPSQDTALIWKKMHDLANGFVWSPNAAADIKHTFSHIRKLLECRECRLHYSTFWTEHPIDLYLTEDENVNDGDFSIKMWVNNCHNEVNVRRHQPVWYL